MVARGLDAPLALVLGLRTHQGRRSLQGTVFGADTGKVVRSGLVALEPAAPAAATLQALGQFLLEGKVSEAVIVRGGAPAATAPDGATAPGDGGASGGGSTARVLRWVLLGTAVGCAGAGAALLALHGEPSCGGRSCPEEYDTLPGGVTLLAVAGAAAVASGVMFYLAARRGGETAPPSGGPDRAHAVVTPWLAPGGAGLGASVTF